MIVTPIESQLTNSVILTDFWLNLLINNVFYFPYQNPKRGKYIIDNVFEWSIMVYISSETRWCDCLCVNHYFAGDAPLAYAKSDLNYSYRKLIFSFEHYVVDWWNGV